ncbi:hypothetical protein FRAAL4131 [Frankia alni ACN14a]|uniref:Uncharacterized protein n=1 Tax=Frankia alni (strain DSM 45986 / CECT 9034 / ACN14a) TaxID=326424 RepID=Q0RI98_FRAAA|nr:hypothetical protein FRAAL4131 [Frankia alni ACN14a]
MTAVTGTPKDEEGSMARTYRLAEAGKVAFHFFGEGKLVHLFAEAPARARSLPLRPGAGSV